MKYWYAVMIDRDDCDWGTGSFYMETAKEMATHYDNGFIAVIDGGYDENGNATTDPICVDEIFLDK